MRNILLIGFRAYEIFRIVLNEKIADERYCEVNLANKKHTARKRLPICLQAIGINPTWQGLREEWY